MTTLNLVLPNQNQTFPEGRHRIPFLLDLCDRQVKSPDDVIALLDYVASVKSFSDYEVAFIQQFAEYLRKSGHPFHFELLNYELISPETRRREADDKTLRARRFLEYVTGVPYMSPALSDNEKPIMVGPSSR
jgi:hypothetical protein